ncbi:ribosome assembly RNA-binding protein YhbY [Periweissella beninensis]|uniref:Ribosome assembly RNA-binding protein YhbY n=1 Tax=Periweissella beninensis TaxID=504936 RepID=A0ABT0VHV6_9LACO|nr:ribosome assembly RNA-binding protein YhbY [Periweissella beninensis]MBM7544021.1 putative YhbY family RNA-binding protein [Periweissella beninensis]MCM2437421.1 ribosome assembly RNA-binding protein YhbY [Periweissella beninensis]MCT4396530.1 ribosome assembly RNA-binding protein YhbY [Periweissella beninensis]
MTTLRGKQKRYLRAQAHTMNPIFSVGKNGLSKVWLNQLTDAIEKRELFKISLQQNADVDVAEVKEYIENNSALTVVQTIGHVLVIYKRSDNPENRKFSLTIDEI